MSKLWKGRFKKKTHPLMEAFTESISFDRELAYVDLRASMAHARMLAKVGLLSRKELTAIIQGLKVIEKEVRDNTFVFDPGDEDIHMAIEAALTRMIGEPAKKLHTARSRNDQVATDMRLWTRGKIDWIDRLLHELQHAILNLAAREKALVIPGYTHLQRAQPVLLGQHLMAYIQMLQRDRDRLQDARKRVNLMPLGSCALAGTTLAIDREFVAKSLGFAGLCENSMDAVSDRDFIVEVMAGLAILFVHLSRFAEDVILWASSEWRLVVLDDAWSTGSSIMPQKRNPDLMELTRGKSGRVIGNLVGILTVLKGLPMTYNRDLQEDKEGFFDAVRTAEATLACLAEFVPSMEFDHERAREMMDKGFLEATAMAEYLVEKGVPFRDAHAICGGLVRVAEETDCALRDISLGVMRKFSPVFDKDVFSRLDPLRTPASYRSVGNAGPVCLNRAIRRWKRRLTK